MEPWLSALTKTLATRCAVTGPARVLVAVSGGVDSMVLLQHLHAWAQATGSELGVAHANHQLRGRSSAADEKFVQTAAARLGWPCFTAQENIRALAAAQKISLEMAAREWRHAFLAATARTHNFPVIALAHHADDQVELFFLRLLRGAGGEGLGGMKWTSPSPADARLRLIRPLLAETKTDLLAFAQTQRLAFRTDVSNASKDFLRNRIRHELLPLLADLQPGYAATILRTMTIAGDEAEAIRAWAGEFMIRTETPPPVFSTLPVAVQRSILRPQLPAQGFPADFDLVESLRLHPAQPVTVAPGQTVTHTGNGHLFRNEPPSPTFVTGEKTLPLARTGSTTFGSLRLRWKVQAKTGTVFQQKPGTEHFDAEKVGPTITLRYWRRGDRFQPVGLPRAAKLQDLFVNLKVPVAARHQRLVAVATSGEIFWVQGLRMAENFKLTPATRRRLVWTWATA